MTEKTESTQPQGAPATRKRKRIYGERVTIHVRLSPELRDRLMAYCDELEVPANRYLTQLIEADLTKKDR